MIHPCNEPLIGIQKIQNEFQKYIHAALSQIVLYSIWLIYSVSLANNISLIHLRTELLIEQRAYEHKAVPTMLGVESMAFFRGM